MDLIFSHNLLEDLVVQPFYWAIAISQCRISICVTRLLSVVHVLPFSGVLSYLCFTIFFVYKSDFSLHCLEWYNIM